MRICNTAFKLNKLKNISFHLSISKGVNLFDAMTLINKKVTEIQKGRITTHARTIQIRTQTSCKNRGYNWIHRSRNNAMTSSNWNNYLNYFWSNHQRKFLLKDPSLKKPTLMSSFLNCHSYPPAKKRHPASVLWICIWFQCGPGSSMQIWTRIQGAKRMRIHE